MDHARLYDIMSGQADGFSAGAVRLGLSILEPGYRLGVTVRNRSFDTGKRTPVKLPRPVISVGNITTGGTGKTPMVIELARRLTDTDQRPAVLMRGYMKDGNAAESDEAAELQRALGDAVPVMPDPDRVEGARRVLEQHPGTTVFLLDDGFQHRQVHRDLDIVLIDATRPFGFGHLLPRGLLREPATNLRRADAVIVTRCDLVSAETLANLDRRIESLTGKPPIAHAQSVWSGFRDADNNVLPTDHLQDKKIIAACAIGNPAAFTHMLEAAVGDLLHVHSFDDHHVYTPDDVRHVLNGAKSRGADAAVVTEKDWVKWGPIVSKSANVGIADGPTILRPRLGVQFRDGEAKLEHMLGHVIDRFLSCKPDAP